VILLDTNVLSALMQRRPEPAVVDWLDARGSDEIFITSITLFEARFGVNVLAKGKRRAGLQKSLDALVGEDLDYRIVSFDLRAADRAAELAAKRKRLGRPVDIRDTFIAGIAIANGATLATHNTLHFDDLPVPVINPWEAD
jgi:predicted nucleic acid-binding protein